jgi:hypothetical protein
MFARIAKVLTPERPHAVQVQSRQTFSKIQEPDGLNAPLRRRRPVLVRRWHLDSVSGKPVCAWEVEGPDLPRDLGIGPFRPMQEPQLLCVAVLPRRATGQHFSTNETSMSDGPRSVPSP